MIVKVYFERRKYESWYPKELNYENRIVLQSLKQASPKAIDAENRKVDTTARMCKHKTNTSHKKLIIYFESEEYKQKLREEMENTKGQAQGGSVRRACRDLSEGLKKFCWKRFCWKWMQNMRKMF